LVNNHIYTLTTGGEFEKTFLGKDRILRDIPTGTTSVKARNRNLTGRSSPFVTKSVQIDALPISKVTNIRITEGLYTDALGGVAVRATIKFAHITGQEVTDYELSYRTDNADNTDLSSFSTVKIPANNIDDQGDITFVINNIDRGAGTTVNLIVRITALNKNLKGATAQTSKPILGKTAKPQNILNFGAGQTNNQITLFWEYPRQADGSLVDLDLKEVVIRRIQGSQTATEDRFLRAADFVTVAAGVSRKSSPIDSFGQFTYLARTRDTSGNFSDDISAVELTTFRPGGQNVVKAFNSDDPSTQFAGVVNDNASESAFVSFTDTVSGGVNVAALSSTVADRANASATGWTYDAGGTPTDLQAAGDATYISPIRDVGSVITGSIQLDIQGTGASKTTFRDFTEDLISGATEAQSSPNNTKLRETNFGGIGTVLGFSNTAFPDGTSFSVTFSEDNKTLVDNETTQNVYAIINPGQYTGNVKTISGITKASPAVITTSTDHGLTVTAAITAITKANPAVVTSASHGFSNGDQVLILNVGGMTELNGTTKTVANKTDDTFQLSGTDSSGFGTYTSGGTAARVSTTTRVIIHDVEGMTEINNRELFTKYTSNTTAELYTDSSASTALNSSGFTTYTSGGVTDRGDFANANALAFIHKVDSADTISLGLTFNANGTPTGGNTFANVVTENSGVNNYKLVNLRQFKDETATTFAGSTTGLTQQTFIRTASTDEELLFKVRTEDEIVSGEGVHTNANINVASFDFSANGDDGFIPYEAGSKRFRFFQTKFVVLNSTPNEIDFTLDKFRVSVEKDQTTLNETVTFDNTIKFVSFGDSFFQRPSVSITPFNTATAQVAFTVEVESTHVAFKLFDIENDALTPTTQSVQVTVSATGI
jgi:hypothetical protein